MTPSVGSVIRARGRLWRADAIDGEVLTATPLDGAAPAPREFYLPFESVEEAHLSPPDGAQIGTYARYLMLLRAYRLTMMHGFAPLLSLQRSSVIPDDYQLVPVLMALDMPRVRLLLADDVGLGKTVEAGLIATELLGRNLASRVLVVCPASLREQWREALARFFHLEARIVSSHHVKQMERQLPPGVSPWEHFRYLITSIDYAKTLAVRSQVLSRQWDLVIIDEAHQVAKPHQVAAEQRVDMDRWNFARQLADRCRHLLLLTATPHNGYTDTFASLLDLLRVGAVDGPAHEPTVRREVAVRHVCQRRREDVQQWFASGGQRSPFPRRDQREDTLAPSAEEEAVLGKLQQYSTLVLDAARDASRLRQRLATWTVLHLQRRALSSPHALRQSLRSQERSILERLERAALLEAEQEAERAGEGFPEEAARAVALDQDPGEGFADEEEAGTRVDRLVFGSPAQLRAQLDAVRAVQPLAERVTPSRDRKLQHLVKNTLPELLRDTRRLVVFTRYKDTLDYLQRQLADQPRFADERVLAIHGQMTEGERAEVFAALGAAPRAILLATDCISEGVNLQQWCAAVVHYELPWNPNRLEQRNGRVDRYGQPSPQVRIRTLVMDGTVDAAVLAVLVQKARRIRDAYGFSPPFFGDDASIIDLIREQAPRVRLRPAALSIFEQGAAPAPLMLDPFAKGTLERIRADCYYGQTQISLPRIRRRLQETERETGSPAEIRAFVLSALRACGCRVDEQPDGLWRVTVHDIRLLPAGQGRVLERVTFDPRVFAADAGTTMLDLGHPLVRRLLTRVQDDTFTPGEGYGRTAYIVTAAATEVTAVLHLLARFVVGTEPPGILEELVPVGLPVYGNGVLRSGEVDRLLTADPSPATRSPAQLGEVLRDLWSLPDLAARQRHVVDARLAEHRRSRAEFRAELAPTGDEAAWFRGIDQVELASWDLLSLCLYLPA